jgi:Mrp family chromosome partitioning ATPase
VNKQSPQDYTEDTEKAKQNLKELPNSSSKIKRVIAVISGKGGVGKSIVTSMLGVTMRKRGHNVAILDADITGPSIPKSFGIKTKATGNDLGIIPLQSSTGIKIMSINLLLEHDTDPVIWRGPLLGKTVKQFWTDVIWGNIDYMFIDMPPGTGDVPLTIFQSLIIDGIIIVTSPQELVSMIVSKAINMAEMMKIPVFGLVENFSYFICPDNFKIYSIFGESHIDDIAKAHNLKILAKIPIDPKLSIACDKGSIEDYEGNWFNSIANLLENEEEKA